jgi:hypothetical protein
LSSSASISLLGARGGALLALGARLRVDTRQLRLGNRHEARRRGRGHGRACLACLRRGLMGEVTREELAAMTGRVGLGGKRVGPLLQRE